MERMLNKYSFEMIFPELKNQNIEPNSLNLNALFHVENTFIQHIYEKLPTGFINPFLKRKDKYNNLIQTRYNEMRNKKAEIQKRLKEKQSFKNMPMTLPIIEEKVKKLKQKWSERNQIEHEKVLFHLPPNGGNRYIMLQYAATFKYLGAKIE